MIVEGKAGLYRNTIRSLYEKAGEILNEDFSKVVVSINFVKSDEIKVLNKEFRQVEKETDVLSFPNLNKTSDQKLSEFLTVENMDGDNLLLGDIVICKKVAKMQAKQFGHSAKREVCFLALHGLLHLLGYDHIEKEDEELMNATAEKILSSFGVER